MTTNGPSAFVLLSLLEHLERQDVWSQRRLSAELGIALGLVNAYLKRCVKKGLIKARKAPARRYAYYLTPKGLTEKSRLTMEYLSSSFHLFRQAKEDCTRIFETTRDNGFCRIVLAGRSDLAEIAAICAIDTLQTVVAVVEPNVQTNRFLGAPLVASFDAVDAPFDAIVVTDFTAPAATYEAAIAARGRDRVFVPAILRLHLPNGRNRHD